MRMTRLLPSWLKSIVLCKFGSSWFNQYIALTCLSLLVRPIHLSTENGNARRWSLDKTCLRACFWVLLWTMSAILMGSRKHFLKCSSSPRCFTVVKMRLPRCSHRSMIGIDNLSKKTMMLMHKEVNAPMIGGMVDWECYLFKSRKTWKTSWSYQTEAVLLAKPWERIAILNQLFKYKVKRTTISTSST